MIRTLLRIIHVQVKSDKVNNLVHLGIERSKGLHVGEHQQETL